MFFFKDNDKDTMETILYEQRSLLEKQQEQLEQQQHQIEHQNIIIDQLQVNGDDQKHAIEMLTQRIDILETITTEKIDKPVVRGK